jgi:FKBP-type peptidyl-prolyl cis-trans isomerase
MKAIVGGVCGFGIAALLFAGVPLLAQDGEKDAPAPKTETKPADKPKAPEFKSSKEKASFCIGQNLGMTIRRDFGRGDVIDETSFAKGLKTGLAGEQAIPFEELREAIVGYRTDVVKEDAVRFLDANKIKEGVKTTASGLQYMVLKAGSGATPKATDKVKVHYTGTLVNGKKFDSSVDRGEPTEFRVDGVIKGWTEALQLMKVGDKWRLFIPPEIGYGAKGAGADIPPHAVLIFEVELLGVN